MPGAPYGIPLWYRVRVWQVVDGVKLYSAWAVISAAVASYDRESYLIAGRVYYRVDLIERGTISPVQGITLMYGLGSTVGPRIDRTPVAAYEGSGTTFAVRTAALRDTMIRFLTDMASFRIRFSPTVAGCELFDDPSRVAALVGTPSGSPKGDPETGFWHVKFNWVTQEKV